MGAGVIGFEDAPAARRTLSDTPYQLDIFQRINGGVGSSLYVKESGNSTTTGWKAK